ncbi:hypothetical protein AMAG_19373 [Allomyces macrogynus ATCC 38327]|uniref:Uncharacterized protein n=1 Tax=Allomyces macrogynus (strain ATCC 38327) TaxID=578462 RepID=A0A0L0SUK0_ALLM3|nr:hypothetical protein AMAG_19373 [Allomyces macrogynus ATCC 38327]|eukprot:KNE66268.1 hypothetical protein AMAG_19373 [Allomyces macrogynus ATCC 38327]
MQFARHPSSSAYMSSSALAVLSVDKIDELVKATALAFSVVGADKQVWIGGMEKLANGPVVLVAKAAASEQAVALAPDNVDSEKFVLCKSV